LRSTSGHLILVGLLALFVVASPGKCRALELGLTPSHVYSLWLNINRSLLAYAHIVLGDEQRQEELEAMRPAVFKDKVPADVYALARKTGARLRGYIAIPSEVPHWLHEYEKINSLPAPKDEKITPSAVFLISTQLLNGVVDVVVDNTGWEQSVSDLYATELHFDKTPSDVFGLVDLALRRLEIILADQP